MSKKLSHSTACIFVLTKADVLWALEYKKKNAHTQIFALNLELQLLLNKYNHYPFEYYKFTPARKFLIPTLYEGKIITSSLIYQVKKEIKKITNNFKRLGIVFDGFPFEKLFFYSFVYEISDVLYINHIAEQIKKSGIKKIYIPTNCVLSSMKWAKRESSIGGLLQELLTNNLEIINYESSEEKKWTQKIIYWVNAAQQFPNKLLIWSRTFSTIFQIILIQFKRNKTNQTPSEIVFHSGGQILRYYYNFFSNCLEKSLRLSVITYKQSWSDRLFALKKNLPEVIINNDVQFAKHEVSSVVGRLEKIENKKTGREKLLYKKIIKSVSAYGFEVLENCKQARDFFNNSETKLFMSTHDPSPQSRAFILAAQEKKVKTISLQHGIAMNPFEVDFLGDVIFSWGEIYHPLINKSKSKNITISPIGFPKIDEIPNAITSIPNDNVGLKIGLLLTIYLPFDEFSSKFLFELFSQIAKENKKYQLSLRTHSGQNIEGIYELAKEYHVSMTIDNHSSLEEFIYKNDIILSWDTTAIMWPMLFSKPLFHTCPLWGEGILPTKKYRAAWTPESAADLISQIEMIINNPHLKNNLKKGQQQFVKDFFGKQNGKISSDMAKEVSRQLKKGK